MADVGAPSAVAATAMLHAMDRTNHDFASFFYSELYPKEARKAKRLGHGPPPMAVLQSALFVASQRKKHGMVRDVLELLMTLPPSEWNASVYRNALYCCAQASMGELSDTGLELIEWFMTDRLPFDPDEFSLFDSMRIAKHSSMDDQYALLHAYSERNRWPGLMAYTVMMEAHLQANAPSSYGHMVVEMMDAQNIRMDLKFATVYALLLVQNHDIPKLLHLIRSMVVDEPHIEPDLYFFSALLTMVAHQAGMDGCFELVASVTSIRHFEGVLERVCNVVMQMECEGFAMSSAGLVQVIQAVSSNREMDKVVSIVAQMVAGGPRVMPFDETVFSALWTQLDKYSCANKVSLKFIQQQATSQGFERTTSTL
ncbi:hypothetical protein AaE_012220 [Aphanomyces astaci]|uniref:Pentacotripeptide-repeat region of PRORP domain-containing protein n=1 Tax=Aphanomyces astaci TaxID=112090 RepID=A0A6A4ZDA1_APHAT|nr:hypothetical protein AaE_012220 [Aphanomyces astaci]